MKKNIYLLTTAIVLLIFAACDNVNNNSSQKPITNHSNITTLTDATTANEDTLTTDSSTLASNKKLPSLGIDRSKFKYVPKKKAKKPVPKPKKSNAKKPTPQKPKPKPKKITSTKHTKTPSIPTPKPKKAVTSKKNDTTPSNHSTKITSNTPYRTQKSHPYRRTESIDSKPKIAASEPTATVIHSEKATPKTNTDNTTKLATKNANSGFSTQAIVPQNVQQPRTHGLDVVKENKDFYEGQIFIKLKKGATVQLPEFNKSNGTNPNSSHPLNNMIQQYGIVKLYRPFTRLQSMSNVYKAEFKQPSQANQLIKSLQQLSYVEYAEKVPLQKVY